jgi:hypothetical protein
MGKRANRRKIGIAWIQLYRCSTLLQTKEQARGLYRTLRGKRSFELKNDEVTDADFVNPNGPCRIDYVDLFYFSGHGGSSGPKLSDESSIQFERASWGGVLKWMVFDACGVLNHTPNILKLWTKPFCGLRLLLGFNSEASNETSRGRYFAEYLNAGFPVHEAWTYACQETEYDTGRSWAYVRVVAVGGRTSYDDRWTDDTSDSDTGARPLDFVWTSGPC